jgi:hypothetical protein
MSTATAAPPVARPVSRVPSRRELRLMVLGNINALSKGMQTKLLAHKPRIPAEFDVDEFLGYLASLEAALANTTSDPMPGSTQSFLPGNVRAGLQEMHLALSEILSSITGKPRWNVRLQRFERRVTVTETVNSFGDTRKRTEWQPCQP